VFTIDPKLIFTVQADGQLQASPSPA